MIFPLLSLATVALALPSQRPKFSSRAFTNTSCTTSGVHMIVARGSTETTPIGTLLAPLVDGIEQYLPGSDAVGIDYPASLVAYSESVAIGVAAMTALVENYVALCPSSKIVLVGYSQGAQVVGDTICGTTSSGFTQTSALASKYSDNIIAVVQFGDPARVSGYAIDVGTATNDGLFPRTNADGCKVYADRLVSYCDDGDVYCDSGLFMAPHYQYMANYGWNAGAYICEKASEAGVGTCTQT